MIRLEADRAARALNASRVNVGVSQEKPVAGSGSDLEYYQKRAEQEVKLAQRATDRSVVAAHYELSLLYLERVSNLQAKGSAADSEDEAR